MKKAIQFGAGNIGRGFMGDLFHESGYHITFVDVDQTIINTLNNKAAILVDENFSLHLYLDDGSINHFSCEVDTFREVIGIMDVITTTAALSIASGADYLVACDIISNAIKIALKKRGTLTIGLEELLESFEI